MTDRIEAAIAALSAESYGQPWSPQIAVTAIEAADAADREQGIHRVKTRGQGARIEPRGAIGPNSSTDDHAKLLIENVKLRAAVRAVDELAKNYKVRADSSPVPLAQWGDIESDLRRAIGDGASAQYGMPARNSRPDSPYIQWQAELEMQKNAGIDHSK